ncbi:hypothetical protein JTB14_009818 [Gonioctena quinquepunctata]|nr:hypothetical protein JTB14_009818 [Gonioctena quinquepunctata]
MKKNGSPLLIYFFPINQITCQSASSPTKGERSTEDNVVMLIIARHIILTCLLCDKSSWYVFSPANLQSKAIDLIKFGNSWNNGHAAMSSKYRNCHYGMNSERNR